MRPALEPADVSLSLAPVNGRSLRLTEIRRLETILPAVTAQRRDLCPLLTNRTVSVFVRVFHFKQTKMGAWKGTGTGMRDGPNHRLGTPHVCLHLVDA